MLTCAFYVGGNKIHLFDVNLHKYPDFIVSEVPAHRTISCSIFVVRANQSQFSEWLSVEPFSVITDLLKERNLLSD